MLKKKYEVVAISNMFGQLNPGTKFRFKWWADRWAEHLNMRLRYSPEFELGRLWHYEVREL